MSSNNGRRRVVITGLGAVTPLGPDVDSTWSNLIAGRSGAGKITQFDTTGFPVDFGCEVRDFEPTTWIDHKSARRMDRFAQLAVAAARQAEADCGHRHRGGGRPGRRRDRDRHRRAEVLRDLRRHAQRARAGPRQPVRDRPDHPEPRSRLGLDGARDKGPAAVRVHRVRCVEHGDRRRAGCDPARSRGGDGLRRHRGTDLARRHRGLRCDARDLAAERRSRAGVASVRRGARRVRHGRGRRGRRARGARARTCPRRARSTPSYSATASRPTRRTCPIRTRPATARRGRCRWRSATPASSPARSATSTRTGRRPRSAMRRRRACSSSRSARRRRGGRRSPRRRARPVTASARAGAVEAIFTILALQRGVLPPTINYEVPDPECDLDYIPNEAREQAIEIGVSNSFGFGGHNACVVFRRWDETRT